MGDVGIGRHAQPDYKTSFGSTREGETPKGERHVEARTQRSGDEEGEGNKIQSGTPPNVRDWLGISRGFSAEIMSASNRRAILVSGTTHKTVSSIHEAGSDRSSIAISTLTPSNIPSFEDENEPLDVLLLEASALIFSDPHEALREARVLASKVARVASRKFSVEEVVALQQEVDRWLTEVTAADAVRVLSSSSSTPSLTGNTALIGCDKLAVEGPVSGHDS
ncbi:hypothetical protein BGY98DRAFT_1173966 [Russula aff. rugulosa BPL654]|nr:hypothetical protein BGY98DRAFT_1173966 [Russula aff. rugulosa BPL654]